MSNKLNVIEKYNDCLLKASIRHFGVGSSAFSEEQYKIIIDLRLDFIKNLIREEANDEMNKIQEINQHFEIS